MSIKKGELITIVAVVSLIVLLIGNKNSLAVNCAVCHGNIAVSGTHGNVVDCESCHKINDIKTHLSGKVENVDCVSCHEAYAGFMKTNIHYRIKERVGDNMPTCVSCHGYHDIKSPAKSENKEADYCSKCHKDILLTNPFHSAKFVSDKSCLGCHSKEKDYKNELFNSAHAGFACVDCHYYAANNFVMHIKKIEDTNVADCSLCHRKSALEHRESIHGISLMAGVDEAAQCWDCHGSHNILAVNNESSRVFSANLAGTCGACHDDPELVNKFYISAKSPGKIYSQSIHGKLTGTGRLDAASCVSCHGAHDIKNVGLPNSRISNVNVPLTCGKCHGEILEEYQQSIHWIYAKKGLKVSPVCNDCHSEHSVYAINTVDRKDVSRRIQEETCFHCHQNPIVARKFSLTGDQPLQYQDSYHGLASVRLGSTAALCIDCHGAHKILPRSHPESMVNAANVKDTCKKCHVNATTMFSQSYSHQSLSASALKIEGLAKTFYVCLIVAAVGGMILHNLIIFIFQVMERRKKEKAVQALTRFSSNEIIQHYVLAASFIILAFTGFALKYPDLWLFTWLEWIGTTEGMRQYTHRGAGIALIGLGVYHIFYIVLTKRGRAVIGDMVPGLDDIKGVVNNVLFCLRIKKIKRPEFGQFDYTEKMEYWALVWGTIVMAVTGFVLWFPASFSALVPTVWFIKVNEIVHFYEAILATLAIFVWHFFFVVFKLDEYPMSFAWLSGKMRVDHYKQQHNHYINKLREELDDVKSGRKDRRQLSANARLVLSGLEKEGVEPDKLDL